MSRVLVLSPRGPALRGLIEGALGGAAEVSLGPRSLVEGLAVLASQPADVVVIDPAGPLDAVARTQVATARSLMPQGALILVVPADDPGALRSGLQLEVAGLLLDPFDLDQVGKTLRRALQPPPAEDLDEARSLEALGGFLRGITNEVLNPLTSISGIVQLLLHGESGDSEEVSRYRTMLDSVERIRITLHELEQFVKARKPQRSLVSVSAIFDDTAAALRQADPAIEFRVRSPVPAGEMLVDRGQVVEALTFLGRHAAGAAPAQPVEGAVRRLADGWQIEISSTTRVALPERPADVFYPYSSAADDHVPGNLRLAAAFGIARNHHGRLGVETGEGGIVRFRLHLPATLG